jgi:hypothetical protein
LTSRGKRNCRTRRAAAATLIGRLSFRARVTILTAIAAASTVALVATSLAATNRLPSREIFVDGDSLAVGTSSYLQSFLRGWKLSAEAEVGRHADEGVLALRSRGPALEPVIVVDLGTNDDPSQIGRFSSSVKTVVRAAGPSRCVIWSTIHRPPVNGVSYDGYNRALKALDRAYRNLHVFHWAAMAVGHPQWFGADGIHPDAAGYRARAAAVARLMQSC